MLEFYLYMQTVGETPNVKELYFGSSDGMNSDEIPPMSKEMAWLYLILYVIAAYYAVRLSWESNTKLGYSQPVKILMCIFAFMFPFLYLIAHVVFKMDLLKMIDNKSLLCKRK